MATINVEDLQIALDEDLMESNIDGDEEPGGEDDQEDDDDIDVSIRVIKGIDSDKVEQEDKFSFEVIQEKSSSQPCDDFDAQWNQDLYEQEPLNEEEKMFKEMTIGWEDVTKVKDSGVMKQIMIPGKGVVVPKDAFVSIHYSATHAHSKTRFDSSRDRGREQRFQLGREGDIIPGMDIAVGTMKIGEISRFIVHSRYAYGKMGCGPRIPPYSTVIYDIELMSFIPATNVIEKFFAMSKLDRVEVPFKEAVEYIRVDKDEAREYFNNKRFSNAIDKYLRSIRVLEEIHTHNEDEQGEVEKLLIVLYLNVAQCFLNISKPKLTQKYARKVLYLREDNAKALYKLGKAFRLLCDYDNARKYLQHAKSQHPKNAEILAELQEVENAVKRFSEQERLQCRRMFSGGGICNSIGSAQSKSSENRTSSSDLTDDFKESVKNRLEDFIADKDLFEISTGNGANLADFELGYIIETAQSMGLRHRIIKNEPVLHKTMEMLDQSPRE